MRLALLLQLAALAVATSAAPIDFDSSPELASIDNYPSDSNPPHLHDTPPPQPRALTSQANTNGRAKTNDNSKGKARPPTTTPDSRPRRGVAGLIGAVNDFDMATTVTMADPPAPGTNVLSCDQLASAKIPSNLVFKKGNFLPTLNQKTWTVQNPKRLEAAKTLIRSASAVKSQVLRRLVSGETDLTQIMVQALAMPVTEILGVILKPAVKAHWYGVGKGSAPIPDLALQVGDDIRAVVEIKTTDSMPNHVARAIAEGVDSFELATLKRRSQGECVALTLKDEEEGEDDEDDEDDEEDEEDEATPQRRRRGKKVDILEQVSYTKTSAC